MEEGTKLRLVRCPKCENVLPELPNLAVYQCGGCGAVLQAKTPQISSGGSSEKSDDENERVRVGSEKVESFAEKGEEEGDMSGSSEVSDRVSNGIEIRQTRRERGLPNGTNDLNSSSSSRIVNKVVSNENILVSKYDGRSEEHEMARVDKYRRPLKSPVDSWVTGNDQDMNRSREKSFDPQMEIASGSKRSGQIPNWRPRERDGSTAYRRTPRAVAEDVRFSGSAYPDEGTSSYPPDSYGLVEPLRNSNISGGAGRVEHLEQDRAELLRKLDELNLLKDQLARSCDLPDNTKERVPLDGRTIPVDPYVGRESWFPEGSSRQRGPSVQPFAAEKHAQRPLHSNHGLEPIPLINRHGMDMQNFYPPMMHEIPGYGDPFSPQMVGPNKLPHQYQQHPSHDYYSAQYVDVDPDHNASYPANTFFHQPACSCPHCYNKHWHASAQIPPGVLNRRFLDAPANPMFYHADSRGTYNPRGYDPRDANPPPMRREHHLRRQRDLDTETTGFGQSRPRRVLPVKRNGRRCCPIAGGAPFITCHNCFELLPLPKKLLIVEKNYQKVRCGSCSTIISLLFEGKSIIVSVPEQTKGLSPVVDVPSIGIEKESHLHSHAQADHGGAYSSDYDSSGYNFHMTDIEPGSSSMDRRLNLSESEKLQSLASSCSTTSEDEESPDSVIARREVSNSAEPPLKAKGTPPFPGSPLPEYSSSNQVGGKFEKGNRSKRISQEEAVMAKATSRQNSVKDASMATEMDVSFTEYSNGGMSQEYGEVSREDQPRASKGGESFFAGLIKKSFRSHQSGEHDRSNITINAHPISERLVKKAEKQAGPIHPGQYWYDFRAGFWGVFGQPCLGIIPPFIEEFNYPMPKNCAGGNTGVYVNGRELHQKDLDLLANRGLPTDTDKSYIIEISGRVLDEDSGEECENLGKLAPTVEKLKHGFGMRVPRSAAV